MGMESRLDLINLMARLHKEIENSENEIQLVLNRIQEIENIHSGVEQLYGKKFGVNRRGMNKMLDDNELDRMIHLIRATSTQTSKPGFFGIGGMKREEYDTLTDRMNLVISNLRARITDWNQCIDKRIAEVKQEIKRYEEVYQMQMDICEKELHTAKRDLCGEEGNLHLFLGSLKQKMPQSQRIQDAFKTDSMILGLSQNIGNPEPCIVLYEKRSQSEKVSAFIRNLLKQVICKLPLYQYEFYYLDGMNNGNGLREMLEMQKILDAYADLTVPQLCQSGFQMLHLGRNAEEIHNQLAELEQYMGMVTDILQGRFSIFSYNSSHEEKIPYKIVVLSGMAFHAEMTLIKKLVINGAKCGIFVILLQDAGELTSEKQYGGFQNELMLLADGMAQIVWKEGCSYFSFAGKEGIERIFYDVQLCEQDYDNTGFIAAICENVNGRKALNNSFAACFPDDYCYGQ